MKDKKINYKTTKPKTKTINAKMGSSLSLIHLPAQSGKTRKMTELINKWNNLIGFAGNSTNDINIIFTSNTKLLTKQTASRIHNDVDSEISELTDNSDDEESMSISVDVKESESKTIAWIQGEKGKKTLKLNDVFAKVTSDDDGDEINNIICCTNKKRMKSVFDLLIMLNKKFIKRNFNKNVNIWIDEADACIKIWSKYRAEIEDLIDGKFVKNIVLVTATMVPVYDYLHSIGIEPNLRVYENTHAAVYHKYSESEIQTELSKLSQNSGEHIRNVLSNSQISVAGTKLFCPGNKSKKSHELNCEILLEHGFNVLLLNGTNKEFRMLDGTIIPISECLETDLEVSKTLNKIYFEHKLFEHPFAVTGNLCIGRGITFASKFSDREFIFTHGIIPDVSNGDEGYQMVARCCGNIKGFDIYKKPVIFVSSKTDALIRQQENLAIEFAKKYFQGEDEDEVVKITAKMLSDAIGKRVVKNGGGRGGGGGGGGGAPVIDSKSYRVYDNESDIIHACKILGYGYRKTKDESGGFKKTSLNKKAAVASLKDAIEKVPTAYGTNDGVKTWRTYYPCYENVDDVTTLRFVLIIRPDASSDKVAEVAQKYPGV